MTKRSVALVGVLIVMAMIGSSVIGAVSAWATSDAANGTYSVFLPLIMNAIGAMAEVPQGAVMSFNLASCPSGWTEVTDAQGRAIVGLPSGGALSGTVGVGLGDVENRTHTHYVNPSLVNTSMGGTHPHTYNPPSYDTTDSGSHINSVNPPGGTTSSEGHAHQWSEFDGTVKRWNSWNNAQTMVSIMTWDNGMDSAGSGNYPLSRNLDGASGDRSYFTERDIHVHSVSIPTFNSDSAGIHNHSVDIGTETTASAGSHLHSLDIDNTISTTASTSDIMPYIQFLVCEKD